MASQGCLSDQLPTLTSELDSSEWQSLRALAAERIVAVRIVEGDASLLPACKLPGRYHEPAAAPDSPGRAWLADRLLFHLDELEGCETATHAVAAFAIAEHAPEPARAVALPLPCPPLGLGLPRGCIGEGMSDEERNETVVRLYKNFMVSEAAFDASTSTRLLLDIAALLPETMTRPLADYLGIVLPGEQDGGCLLLSEAEFLENAYDATHESSVALVGERLAPSREHYSCGTRPSFSTCFPVQYKPGEGMNCW